MAGRWKRFIENTADRPYWQYVAVLDSRTRPAHRAMDGKVFRHDDTIWQTHFPPNGFGCRCRVRALTKQELRQGGLRAESSEGALQVEDTVISGATGESRAVTIYRDPKTGREMSPDTGWNYNPGRAAWFPTLDNYSFEVARKWVEGGLTGPDFLRFFEGKIGGEFPVAVLSPEYMKLIKSRSTVVYLSNETLLKNLTNHPDLSIGDYQIIPDIIQEAQLIVQDNDNTIVFLRINNRLYYGAIKTTRSGETNFLISLRFARESDIKSIKTKGKVLKDEL
ncbi:MAG: phage head morphogenesis protein [Deltaproteobacteria bacterium]